MEAIRRIGVLGAGQMGGGIAQTAAASGFEVCVADASITLAEAAKARIVSSTRKLVEKSKLTGEEAVGIAARITPVASMADFGGCELVIEAVTESLETKLKIFAGLDAALPEGVLLASNTSSISITRIAAATRRPEKVIGLHFFNPVPVMKLVEVIRGLQTSDETHGAAMAVAAKMNKTAVTTRDAPGFMVNRVLIPMLNEAVFALEQGVGTARDIDTAAKLGLNHPMGPLELCDFIGLDTVLAIADVLQREFGDDKYRPPVLLRSYVAAGWLGRKSGRGFYSYA